MELSFEKYPAIHMVARTVVGQLYPAGQSMHVEEAADEYVPFRHGIFTPPVQAFPASQLVQLMDASSE